MDPFFLRLYWIDPKPNIDSINLHPFASKQEKLINYLMLLGVEAKTTICWMFPFSGTFLSVVVTRMIIYFFRQWIVEVSNFASRLSQLRKNRVDLILGSMEWTNPIKESVPVTSISLQSQIIYKIGSWSKFSVKLVWSGNWSKVTYSTPIPIEQGWATLLALRATLETI